MRDLLTTLLDELLRGWAFRVFGLFVAAAVTASATAFALLSPDYYASRAQIYVNTDTVLKPLLHGLAVQDNLDQQVTVLQRTLLSDPNLERVAKQVDLDLEAETPAALSQAVSRLRSAVTVQGVGNELFSIEYTNTDAQRARDVVQALLSIFIESNLGQSRTDMQSARDFVEKQIAIYEVKLRAAERKLADFRVQNLGVLGEGSFAQRLDATRVSLVEAQTAYSEALALRDQLKAELSSTDRFIRADEPPKIIVGDALIVSAVDRINTLRSQLDTLRLRYTDNHPDVIATRRELETLVRLYLTADELGAPHAALERPADETPEGASNTAPPPRAAPTREAAVRSTDPSTPIPMPKPASATGGPDASADEPALVHNPTHGELRLRLAEAERLVNTHTRTVGRAQERLESVRALASSAPSLDAQLADLTRDYEVMKANYEELLKRREAARLSQAVDRNVDIVQFRIIEPATVSATPAGPNRQLWLALGLAAGLAGGVAAASLRALAESRFVSADELGRRYSLPVIGTVSLRETASGRFGRGASMVSFLIALGALIGAVTLIILSLPLLNAARNALYSIVGMIL